MRMMKLTALVVAIAAGLSERTHAQDQDLSLVINPHTGAASIRNDTGAAVSIDGYLLTSAGNVFNPASWSTLTANVSYPGWAQGPAEPNRLGEANLLSSLSIGGGNLLGLGSPYLPFSPTQIGEPEPALQFEYHVAGGGSFVGDVVFAPQNNVVLIVDPSHGTASLQNQSNFDVSIDGLLIKSPAGVLNPVGWNGLAESGVAGWTKGAAETNRLAEGNLLGSTFFAANGAPVSIGAPINPAAIEDETDLVFEYHVAGGGSVVGGVVFAAAAAESIAGDYNSDGTVNAADYTVWRDRLGTSYTLAGEKPGAATPGLVDTEDYDFWKSRFGATSGSGSVGDAAAIVSGAVPEPGAGFLALAGVSLLALSAGRTARGG